MSGVSYYTSAVLGGFLGGVVGYVTRPLGVAVADRFGVQTTWRRELLTSAVAVGVIGALLLLAVTVTAGWR